MSSLNTRYTILLMAILLALPISSCRKNKWKKPTDVKTIMDINRLSSSSGNLRFTGGYIRLASFSIQGQREQGDDIYFNQEWSNGAVINFDNSAFQSQLDYDIPQGSYTLFELDFETFDDNGDISILVEGIYTNQSGADIPLRFEFLDAETFEVFAESNDGGPAIILDKDVVSTLAIELDPVYWFQLVSISMLENADLTNISGVPTIVISDSENSDIFDIIADRVDESAEAAL